MRIADEFEICKKSVVIIYLSISAPIASSPASAIGSIGSAFTSQSLDCPPKELSHPHLNLLPRNLLP